MKITYISISKVIFHEWIGQYQLSCKTVTFIPTWFLGSRKQHVSQCPTISFRARSVKIFSCRHCSTSGRQCSGIIISALLETDELIVETETDDGVADEGPAGETDDDDPTGRTDECPAGETDERPTGETDDVA